MLNYASDSIKSSLGRTSLSTNSAANASPGDAEILEGAAPLQNLDVMLPRVCEAIILVSQCFCTMALVGEDGGRSKTAPSPSRRLLSGAIDKDGIGLIEGLIGAHVFTYYLSRDHTFGPSISLPFPNRRTPI